MKSTFYIPPKERLGLIALVLLIISIHTTGFILLYMGSNSNTKYEQQNFILSTSDIQNMNYNNQGSSIAGIAKEQKSLYPPGIKDSNLEKGNYNMNSLKSNGSNQALRKGQKKKINFSQDELNVEQTEKYHNQQSAVADPNSSDFSTLRAIGLPGFIATNIIKYREKGGSFDTKEDLLKIYGMDSLIYNNISSKIIIDSTIHNNLIKSQTLGKPHHNIKINVNTATSQELIELKGIGPVLSKRIVSYREKLGGFYDIKQISEVYGIRDSTFQQILPYLSVSGDINKLFIPALSFKEVLKHPYIDFETTKLVKNISLLNFEKEISNLIQNEVLDHRLIPYLHLKEPGQ